MLGTSVRAENNADDKKKNEIYFRVSSNETTVGSERTTHHRQSSVSTAENEGKAMSDEDLFDTVNNPLQCKPFGCYSLVDRFLYPESVVVARRDCKNSSRLSFAALGPFAIIRSQA